MKMNLSPVARLMALAAVLFAFSMCSTSSAQQYQNLPGQEFVAKAKADPTAVILDVRTPQEFAAGNVKGAVNIDIYSPDFDARINALDKTKTYYVYCRSGARSAKACSMMGQKGFKKLYNMTGGYLSL